jgi:hypothetical protein
LGLGTAINVAAVLVGGGIGTLAGAKLPEGMRATAMQAIGIVTLLVGVANFIDYGNPLVPLVSVVAGLIVGELVGIEAWLEWFGDYLEKRFSKGESPVSRAFVTTSLLFCVGPLTVVGSLEGGLRGDYGLLALKSALDFIAALTFASMLGWGVLLSAGTILLVQGLLTLGGRLPRAVRDGRHDLGGHRDRGQPYRGNRPGSSGTEAGAGRKHVARFAIRSAAGRRGAALALLARVLW